ncbi:MAG: hypothetical protein KAS39_07580, partial [Actinomycetia bacterium]|nr:hypothetical protein [Actinomycetes bacterium]
KDFPVPGAYIKYKDETGYIKSMNFLSRTITLELNNRNTVNLTLDEFKRDVEYKPPTPGDTKTTEKLDFIADEDLVLEEEEK